MRVRTFFVGACLAAAVWPGLAASFAHSAGAKDAAAPAAGARSSIEWPARFRGGPLTQLAASPLEARFDARFAVEEPWWALTAVTPIDSEVER